MTAPSPQRFLSLDIFRGITIAFMIMVNNRGPHSFKEMQHAEWHGFTLTDLVWPSFLFVMGAAMIYAKRKWETMPQKDVIYKIIKRTVLIFLIGYLMNWFPFMKWDSNGELHLLPISETRILGVLQRIALCYGITALLVYYFSLRTLIILSAITLVGYWLLMARYGNLDSKSANLHSVIDIAVLTPDHMYKLGARGYDPSGILGTFPAVVNTIAGYICANYLSRNPKGFESLAKISMAGFACISIAYLWNLVFPYNKNLWTSSFVMLTVGIDCLIYVCLIYIIDFLGHKKWTRFFDVFGKNPLFIYVFSSCLPGLYNLIPAADGKPMWSHIYRNIFAPAFGDGLLASFLYCCFFMFLCWLMAWWMDRNKIYIKI